MTSSLPLLTDEEVARGTAPAGDEAGVGALATERGNLPLEAIDVATEITGLVARTALTQSFGNPFDQPLEATYIFPLPDRAAVSEFRMEVGDRVVQGVLKERGEARATYDEAVREGRRASIAEEERPGVFTMRVGNLLPGEVVRVRLVMTGPLPWDEGEATFRFPLVVAPRYIPGAPLEGEPVGAGTVPDTDAVPDASRITPPVLLPGFPNPVRLGIRVEIDPAGVELGEVRSSLHAVVEEQRDGHGGPVRVLRVEPGERANRDFVLRLRTGGAAVATSLAAVPDATRAAGDCDGTFALTLLPPVGAPAGPPRDLVFVLDRSGSMAGWKMVAARRAVARMVDSLTDRDRFLVLAFDNRIEAPPALGDGLLAASDHARFQAVEFLSRLDARGGTEMAAPLTRGLDLLARDAGGDDQGAGRPRDPVLVLVTDGQVGNEDQILRLLAPRLAGVRVYTVGVDTAVNEGFLKRLAGLGGGACELVESEDRLDAVMDRVHRRIGAPVVTDLRLEPSGFEPDPDSVAPRRLPALFAGAPLVVCGRYRGEPAGALTVHGRDAAGQSWSATVPATVTGTSALAAMWARTHLRDLEDRYAADPSPDRDLERQIVDVSLRFGVLCRFTAFVAADVQVVNEGGTVHRVLQPVDAPAGWSMFDRVEQAVAAMPMASMTTMPVGGLQAEGRPALGRAAGSLAKAAGRAGGGLLGRPPRSGGFATRPLGGAELAPYRRRAGELARLLHATGPSAGLPGGGAGTPGAGTPGGTAGPPAAGPLDRDGLGRRLGLLQVGLAALVADLESVDAVQAELRPLRDLAAELERALAQQPPTAPDTLARLRERALAVLAAFAAGQGGQAPAAPSHPGPPEPAPPPNRTFWKR
jgi:Ca-activated chloride channel homolog